MKKKLQPMTLTLSINMLQAMGFTVTKIIGKNKWKVSGNGKFSKSFYLKELLIFAEIMKYLV